jgi:hypothetical protein
MSLSFFFQRQKDKAAGKEVKPIKTTKAAKRPAPTDDSSSPSSSSDSVRSNSISNKKVKHVRDDYNDGGVVSGFRDMFPFFFSDDDLDGTFGGGGGSGDGFGGMGGIGNDMGGMGGGMTGCAASKRPKVCTPEVSNVRDTSGLRKGDIAYYRKDAGTDVVKILKLHPGPPATPESYTAVVESSWDPIRVGWELNILYLSKKLFLDPPPPIKKPNVNQPVVDQNNLPAADTLAPAAAATTSTMQKTEGGGGFGGSASPMLAKTLRKEAGIIRRIVEMTSVPQTFLLLTTCKELHAAKEDIFGNHKLPMVCYMRKGDGFKLYRAMVGVPISRWWEWLDTSGVQELSLPTSSTDKEILTMFGGMKAIDKVVFDQLGRKVTSLSIWSAIRYQRSDVMGRRFSDLRTLDLSCCINITDASVLEVTRRCSSLQSLNLAGCKNITGASVLELARQCSNLQSLNLYKCIRITEASVVEVARRCSNLHSLNLAGCISITDASVVEVARRCSNLYSLNLAGCLLITDVSVLEVGRGCPSLRSLDLTDSMSMLAVTRPHSMLACKTALRKSHPQLVLIDSSHKENN